MGADGDDQLRALVVREQQRDVLRDPRCGDGVEGHAEPLQPRLPGCVTLTVGVDEDLGAAAQRGVGDRVHVAHDHVRLPALLEQGLGPAVDRDEHGPEVAHVPAHDLEVALEPRPTCDHERVPVAEARLERREVDPFGEQLPFLAQIAERVVGELLQRLGDAALLLEQRSGELALLERTPRRHAGAVAEEAGAAHGQPLAVGELVEEARVVDVDQAHTAANELERAGVGVAPRLRGRDVDDDSHARLDELLGRDAVEVGVVDDRDVVGVEAPDELLRPLAEACRAGVLDQAHRRVEMNSLPPSMRSSSSRRWASSSGSIRVWVGSPGTFVTR